MSASEFNSSHSIVEEACLSWASPGLWEMTEASRGSVAAQRNLIVITWYVNLLWWWWSFDLLCDTPICLLSFCGQSHCFYVILIYLWLLKWNLKIDTELKCFDSFILNVGVACATVEYFDSRREVLLPPTFDFSSSRQGFVISWFHRIVNQIKS